MYSLVDRIEFSDDLKGEEVPFITKEMFISRFMLSTNVYREQKNFIRINLVEDSYSRLPFANQRNYKRVDFVKDETLIGIPSHENRKIVNDTHTIVESEKVKLLMNFQFYLSDDFV